jgi:hypothetical protein
MHQVLIGGWGKVQGWPQFMHWHFLTPADSIFQLDAVCFVRFIPVFNGTSSVVTVFTKSRHWTLSWTRWIKFTNAGRVLLPSYPLWTSRWVFLFQMRTEGSTHLTFTLITIKKWVKTAEPNPMAISFRLSYGLWERVVSTDRPLSKPWNCRQNIRCCFRRDNALLRLLFTALWGGGGTDTVEGIQKWIYK